MRLSRDDLLKAEDLAVEEVDLSGIPGYHGSVLVRGLTGRERDEYELSVMERRGNQMVPNLANTRAKIAVKCVVDEDGNRVFTDQDANALGEKSSAMVDRIYAVAARLSGLSEKDEEEMTGNFGGPNGVSSSSPSPPVSAGPSPSSSVP